MTLYINSNVEKYLFMYLCLFEIKIANLHTISTTECVCVLEVFYKQFINHIRIVQYPVWNIQQFRLKYPVLPLRISNKMSHSPVCNVQLSCLECLGVKYLVFLLRKSVSPVWNPLECPVVMFRMLIMSSSHVQNVYQSYLEALQPSIVWQVLSRYIS